MEPMKLSIIIPVFNESEMLGKIMAPLSKGASELIVVDGGSNDNTVELAGRYTPRVYSCPKGRGLQQHTGARQSKGDVLLFLHADTRLPGDYEKEIGKALSEPSTVFGAFRLGLHPPSPALNLVSAMANLRSRLLKLPYGDQAIFARRSAYFRAGGFKDWPIMEDVDLVHRLNRIGNFTLIRAVASTSARRWERENLLYTTLRNWSLLLRYALGVSPHALARRYPDAR